MRKTTPFLPGISAKLYGSHKRRQLEVARIERDKLRGRSITDLGTLFSDVLPVERMEAANSLGPGKRRRRTFPQVIVFWAWASQLLEFNASCNKALTSIQSWYSKAGLKVPEFDNSSYCRARVRLSDEFLDEAGAMLESYAEGRLEPWHYWYGHRLKAIDGTSIRLMDTPENQAEYPQPSGQKPGCGFPVMGVVGVLDLGRGNLEGYVECKQSEHDAKGAWRLRNEFSPEDVVIADRAFCSYELIASLLHNDVQSVMRLHQMRKVDWRRGKKIDPNSRIVTWERPARPGKSGITTGEWLALPETLLVRLVRVRAKGRDGKMRTMYIATTLLDTGYPSEEIAMLYAERWKIEVKFRDIKTTMRLEEFRVRTPAMARKTLRMVQLVYNLIKVRQTEAIRGEAVSLDELAFKDTIGVLNEFRSGFCALLRHPRLLAKERDKLEERIAERTLLIRPGRTEPRAVKLRPKPYQYLTAPRREFIGIFHRSHYAKSDEEAA
ncbi:MAG: IS4 family transposase [Verrucomicrobiales bacterium]